MSFLKNIGVLFFFLGSVTVFIPRYLQWFIWVMFEKNIFPNSPDFYGGFMVGTSMMVFGIGLHYFFSKK